MDVNDDTLRPEDLKILGNVRGTEYVYPERMQQINELTQVMFQTARSWGYSQIDGPTLQPVEFYKAKSSDELLKDGYYVSAGSHTFMLRPEMTPTIAYMLAEAEKRLAYPIRWFSDPQVYRNERPQSGRRRQFGQFNLDRFDVEPMTTEARAQADAEVISEAIETLCRYGLSHSDIVMRINSRAVLEQVFETIGIADPKVRAELLIVIDAKEKLAPEDFLSKTISAGISEEQSNQLNEWFNQSLFEDVEAGSLYAGVLDSPELKELQLVFTILEKHGYADYISYDPIIVRGLGYYTGTVFEATDRHPEKSMGRSILGGGRYEHFTKKFGGKLELTGIGYGMGHVPLEVVLESRDLLPQQSIPGPDYYITVEEEPTTSRDDRLSSILKIAKAIRDAGFSVVVDSSITTKSEARLKKQLSSAGKSGAYTVLILLNDMSRGIAVKDFSTSAQKELSVDDFINQLS